LNRTGKTIKYKKYISKEGEEEEKETMKIEDPYLVIKCDGEKCEGITVSDKDFYENSEKEYADNYGTVIHCKKRSDNDLVDCSIETRISGFYTNSQKELIQCKSTGCTTVEPTAFKNVIPNYYLNGNTLEDVEYPIIICKYQEDDQEDADDEQGDQQLNYLKDGCNVGNPLRGICNDKEKCLELPFYPFTFSNLFVNSGKPMSLIACTILIKKEDGEQNINYSYSCNIIESENMSYYITIESETETMDIMGSLIECIVISNEENSCIEYEKNTLGSSYYINTINKNKIIKCDNKGCITEIGYNYYIDGCIEENDDDNDNDDEITYVINANCYKDSTESASGIIDCTKDNCKKIKGDNRSVYIRGDGEGLLICASDNCKDIESPDREKTFINGSYEKSTKPIIIWDGEKEKWESEAAMAKKLYLNGNSGDEG